LLSRHLSILGIVVSLTATAWPRVVINEILYHAPDSDLEYIELLNTSTDTVDLSKWIIQDDQDTHSFEIPEGTSFPPGEYLVIANDPVLFQQAYGFAPDVSGIPFRFSNSGDTVRLFDPVNALQEEVRYDDRLPWPEAADGGGASLERRNGLLPASLPESWAASANHGYRLCRHAPAPHFGCGSRTENPAATPGDHGHRAVSRRGWTNRVGAAPVWVEPRDPIHGRGHER